MREIGTLRGGRKFLTREWRFFFSEVGVIMTDCAVDYRRVV